MPLDTTRLRDEIKFESVDDLITQMHKDIDDTREYFARQGAGRG